MYNSVEFSTLTMYAIVTSIKFQNSFITAKQTLYILYSLLVHSSQLLATSDLLSIYVYLHIMNIFQINRIIKCVILYLAYFT